MSFDEDEVWHQYAVDGAEALRAIEASLLELEERPGNRAQVNQLYRGLHTLKGNSGFVGMRQIERLAHAAEDMIGLVRDGGVALDHPMVELMLAVVDGLHRMVETAARERRDGDEALTSPLIEAVVKMTASLGNRPASVTSPAPQGAGHSVGPPAASVEAAGATGASEPTPAHAGWEELEMIDPTRDPGFVEVFLSLAAETLPRLGAAMAEALSPEAGPAARATIGQLADDLSLASERMGYVHVTLLLDKITGAGAGASVTGDLAALELDLYEALVAIEAQYRTLTEAPQDFGITAQYQRACANLAFGDLARLHDLLAAPGALSETAELSGLFRRLRGACEYYGFDRAASACLDQADQLGRALESGLALPGALIAETCAFIEQLGQTIHLVNSGAADGAPESERSGMDVPARIREAADDPMKFAPEACGLPLSTPLHHQITRTALGALSRALERGWTVLEVHADLERRPTLFEPFTSWIRQSGSALVTSAVVMPAAAGRATVYQFLLITPLPLEEVVRALVGLDGSSFGVHRLEVGGPPFPVSDREGGPAASEPTRTSAPHAVPATSPASASASAEIDPAGPDQDDRPEIEERVERDERQEHVGSKERTPALDSIKVEFLRIDARKVSLIMDLAGEIGLASSAVTHHPELDGSELPGFLSASHKLEVLVRELQSEVSAMRLLPVAGVFQRMRRVVRDAARRSGKKVNLVLVGEDTEIDKVMVDSLQEPLIHVLRNAIDHGIEAPEARARLGKPATGTIVLEASHQGGEVTVAVSDDGRGLDRERILGRARERGLVAADVRPSDAEIVDLIFLPGFSTKETIDELSGRGVGMDVVKTSIEGLRGRVSLESTPGRGTSITMSVPLTLAFVEAMVVRERERLYAVPIERVFEVFRAAANQVSHNLADGQSVVRVRDKLVPVLWLHRYYGEGPADETLEGRVVVVVQTSHGDLALPVDALLGNQQVMLKPLKGALCKMRAAAGYGMLRSGDVAVTLDCEQLRG
jgi:two-component system chemotaxis sensor kinase CheA